MGAEIMSAYYIGDLLTLTVTSDHGPMMRNPSMMQGCTLELSESGAER